jgi:hypothetical protein
LYLLRNYQAKVSPSQMPLLWLSWAMLLLTLLVLPWQWLNRQGIETETLALKQLWPALWPIALGLLLAGFVFYKSPFGAKRAPLRVSYRRSSRRRQFWSRFPGLVRLEQLLHHWSVVGKLLVLLAMLLIITFW